VCDVEGNVRGRSLSSATVTAFPLPYSKLLQMALRITWSGGLDGTRDEDEGKERRGEDEVRR
jgi:hypothetical protein